MGIVLIASVIMNLVLIPSLETSGASITVVATNFLMFVLGMREAGKIIDYSRLKLLHVFLKVLVSALLMSALAIYLKTFINVFVVIIICGIFYFGFLFLVGGYKKEDIKSITKAFLKK